MFYIYLPLFSYIYIYNIEIYILQYLIPTTTLYRTTKHPSIHPPNQPPSQPTSQSANQPTNPATNKPANRPIIIPLQPPSSLLSFYTKKLSTLYTKNNQNAIIPHVSVKPPPISLIIPNVYHI